METRLLITGFFSRYFPHRCIQSEIIWILCSVYSGAFTRYPSLSCIDLVMVTLDLGSPVDFCIAVLKILSLECKPVGLVSHFFHSLFACIIPLTYK